MRTGPVILTVALAALPAAVRAQETPRRPLPTGAVGMRLGSLRSALPDSIACTRDPGGGEWCRPQQYQRMYFRDSVATAVEVPIEFIAPDSLSGDTVWVRYVLPRAIRMFGAPDSTRAQDQRYAAWWNWDGRSGPRRARVVGEAGRDSVSVKVATMFHIGCSPGVPIGDCTSVGP
jgi:hypothetical protein